MSIMPYIVHMLSEDERDEDSIVSGLTAATMSSWRETPLIWRSAIVAGAAGLVALTALHQPAHLIEAARVAAMTLLVIGVIMHARVLDEFYARLYERACAGAFVFMLLALYATQQLRPQLFPWILPAGLAFWLLATAAQFLRFRAT